MSDPRILFKVTAFVTRTDRGGRELLVFDHPHAGTQLPAGTVEDGEDPAVAVLREVTEETGLTNIALARELAVEETILPPGKRAVLRTSPLFLEPNPDAARHEDVVARNGFWLEARELSGPYRRVIHHVDHFVNGEFITIQSFEGWVLDEYLTERQIRHHYEVRTTAPTQDRWAHRDEGELDYKLYWVPVDLDPQLAGVQAEWRELVLEKLLAPPR